MQFADYGFAEEPSGPVYRQLIQIASTKSAIALLVVRPENVCSPNCIGVLERLQPFLLRKEKATEWPGTRLLQGRFAWVHSYHLGGECAGIVKEAAQGLYDWKQPLLPEDLCLLRANHQPWLVTISHENDGYLSLSAEELSELQFKSPEIARLLMGLPRLE